MTVGQDANLDEGDEIAAETVQVAILGHTDSENRCPKTTSFELNASSATSPEVEQWQAAQYEWFGQTLAERICKMSAPLLKVYKTKHLRRVPVSGRRRRDSRGGRPRCNFGSHRLEK